MPEIKIRMYMLVILISKNENKRSSVRSSTLPYTVKAQGEAAIEFSFPAHSRNLNTHVLYLFAASPGD